MNTEERVRQMMDRARGEEEVSGAEWDTFSASARRSVRMQRLLAAGVGLVLVGAVAVGATTFFDDGSRGKVTPVGPTDKLDPTTDCDGDPCPTEPTGPSYLRPVESWMVDEESRTLTMSWTEMSVGRGDELEDVLEHLLDGASGSQAAAGAVTMIPEGTELLEAKVEDGVATVRLTSDFNQPADGKTSTLRNAQIVYTATQITGIHEVQIHVEGELLLPPMGRDAFPESAPPIVVEEPRIGSEHYSPLEISGTANVFEATVSYELVAENGGYAVDGFTTATCGSGCRGDFSKKIAFEVDEPTQAQLTVFEVSAENGQAMNAVTMPITLLPNE